MVAVRLRQLVTVNALGDGGCTGHFEKEVHITREGFRNGDKGMGDGRVQIALQAYVSPGSGLSPVQHEGGTIPDAYTARTAACRVRQFAAVTQFQFRFLAVSQNHVVILPTQCHVFAQRNLAVVNTYCGVHILSVQVDIGEFDMTECECIYYRFIQPELFCDFRFNHIMKEISPPLIYTPLKIIPELQYFLNGSITYLKGDKVCRDLLSLKRKELAFVLGYYYSDYDLSSLVHPLSKYVNSFQYFVIQNYKKVKTVEELAQLGGYTLSTFRRIFNNVFHEPVYEWMLARRKEGILDDLNNSEYSISEICYKYGFESLPHFSNFCKKSFGASPRNLRRQDIS